MWNCFVGAGDMYPVTLGGRCYMVIATLAGLCLVSLLVNAVADNLRFLFFFGIHVFLTWSLVLKVVSVRS